jgi:hypothetical protein
MATDKVLRGVRGDRDSLRPRGKQWKAFFDTSVLVAAFYGAHEHHEPSFDLFLRHNRRSGCTAAHCLAELYAVATGMPGKDRASPDEALLLADAAALGVTGGGVYDVIALYLECEALQLSRSGDCSSRENALAQIPFI